MAKNFYKFTPRDDITVIELARILWMMGFDFEERVVNDLTDEEKRHFTKIDRKKRGLEEFVDVPPPPPQPEHQEAIAALEALVAEPLDPGMVQVQAEYQRWVFDNASNAWVATVAEDDNSG